MYKFRDYPANVRGGPLVVTLYTTASFFSPLPDSLSVRTYVGESHLQSEVYGECSLGGTDTF